VPFKFLFVSYDGLIGDIAWQVTKEGHAAKYYIEHAEEREITAGFVPQTSDWRAELDWADVVVFDDVLGHGKLAAELRASGKLVVGGTPYSDRLEDDRGFGQSELKAAGVNIIPQQDFTSFDDAIAFVRGSPNRYVIKPSGEAQNIKRLLFVGEEDDGRDVTQVLQDYKRAWSDKVKEFQLQRRIMGVEVAVGAFFNGKEFVLPACVNFEHKRLFDGEIGPSTGEMGTSMFWSSTSPLVKETVLRFTDRLAATGFTGYFDINCIATGQRVVPLEATCRFGYPTINIQMDGVLSPWSGFLAALARGEPFDLRTRRGFQVGVVVAVPPYPFDDPKAFRKYSEDAVVLWRRPLPEGVHPCDVKRTPEGDWLLTGSSGYALVVTGTASTMLDARREAYSRVKAILIPNMFYRSDIGERWVRDGDLLQSWGWL